MEWECSGLVHCLHAESDGSDSCVDCCLSVWCRKALLLGWGEFVCWEVMKGECWHAGICGLWNGAVKNRGLRDTYDELVGERFGAASSDWQESFEEEKISRYEQQLDHKAAKEYNVLRFKVSLISICRQLLRSKVLNDNYQTPTDSQTTNLQRGFLSLSKEKTLKKK